jgi:hypothetical protein
MLKELEIPRLENVKAMNGLEWENVHVDPE